MISAIQVPNIAFNTFTGRNLELVIKKLPSKDLQKRHITSRYCHSNYSTGDKHPTPPSTKAQVLSGHTQQLLIFFNIKCKRKPFPISVLLSLLLYENNLPAFRVWLWLLCFHVIWMQWKISVMATKIKAKRTHLLSHAGTRCRWHLYHQEGNCTLGVNLLPPQTQTPQSHFIPFSNNGTSFLDKHIMAQEQIHPDSQGQLYNAHLSGNKIH